MKSATNCVHAVFRPLTLLLLSPRELWLIYLIKLLNSFALFSALTMFFIFLTDEFDFSYPAAGYVIGVTGLLASLYGVVCGPLIDRLGVKSSYVLGATSGAIGAIMLALAGNVTTLYFALFLFTAFGMALGIPVLGIGVKRFSFDANQSLAFGLFYVIMNVGASLSFAMVDAVRAQFADGVEVQTKAPVRQVVETALAHLAANATSAVASAATNATSPLSTAAAAAAAASNGTAVLHAVATERIVYVYYATAARIIFLIGGLVVCVSALIAALCLRPIHMNEKGNIETYDRRAPDKARREAHGAAQPTGCLSQSKALLKDRFYWRLVAFQFILLGVTMVFRHMDNTMPTYLRNTLGDDVKFGSLKAINPFLIAFLVPVFSALFDRWDIYHVMIGGSTVAALSVFVMCATPSYTATVAFFVCFSVGEAIYSPRAVQYVLKLSPNGMEGAYTALAYIPVFLAKFAADLLSGNLLQWYCPRDNTSNCQTLWVVVGLLALASPVGLFLAKRFVHSHAVLATISTQHDSVMHSTDLESAKFTVLAADDDNDAVDTAVDLDID